MRWKWLQLEQFRLTEQSNQQVVDSKKVGGGVWKSNPPFHPRRGGIAGFEGREGHRTPFAPTVIIHSNGDRRYPPSGSAAGSRFVLKKYGGLHSDPLSVPTDSGVKGCVTAAVCPF